MIKNIKIISIVTLVLFFPMFAAAADLSFSPSYGSYQVGQEFSVSVYVSSPDQAINAASGVVSFSSDTLQAVSLSKSGSIFSLWVQDPAFSNASGNLHFEGVVLNPGFQGASGKIITVTFKVKSAGQAQLQFSGASILANDGNGTEILDKSGSAQFSLSGQSQPATEGTPTPQISSPSHQSPDAWYSDSNPKFRWDVPSSVDKLRLLYDKNASSAPTIAYAPPVLHKEIENVADGVYYLHLQFHSDQGWGQAAHFRFQIDTKKPDYFDIAEVSRQDLTDPKAKFTFSAKDSLSGIGHYEIKIDNGDWQTWQDDGTHTYQTAPIGPGDHKLFAKAVDLAGNFLASSADLSVTALPAPVITEYPKELQINQALLVRATAVASAQVTLFVGQGTGQPRQYQSQSDQNGDVVFTVSDPLPYGFYTLWAQATDSRGAKSTLSQKVTMAINEPAFLRIGSLAINFLATLLSIIALIFLLGFVLFWSWHKFFILRNRLKRELRHSEGTIHKSFDALKDQLEKQIHLIDLAKTQRQLTDVEEKVIRNLKKYLDSAEKGIEKEIKDMEKDVR